MSAVLQARSRLGVASRVGTSDERESARRDLAAEKIAAYVERVVSEAPPLTPDQRARITSILRAA